jgi:choline dehydrogenase
LSEGEGTGERFDYIVVGAGSAGCALAARLAADGRYTVLLLDAGEDDRWIWLRIPAGVAHVVRGERALWRFYTEPEPSLNGRRIFWPRGRVLGGSSTVNGMIWVHGDPAEYNLWRDELGLADWSHEQVKPVFRTIERYADGDGRSRGRSGSVHVVEYSPKQPLMRDFVAACGEAGIPLNADYNGEHCEGAGFLQFNTRRGWRMGAREAFLKPALRRGGLVLRQAALVQRVLFEGRRAMGIAYRRDGRMVSVHCNREVVLCAGAIQSPQLLELSGVGQGPLLQRLGVPVVHDLPAVGENLHDHLHTRMNYEVRDVATLNQIMPSIWRKGAMGLRWLLAGNGLMSVTAQIAHALARSDPSSPRVEVKLQLHWLTSPDARDPNRLVLDDFRGVSVGTFALRPRSRGHVHIASRDAAQAPLMVANYLTHEDDRFNTVAALRMARTVMIQPAMQRWVLREDRPGASAQSDEALLDYAKRIGQTSYHPVGSCRMGIDGAAVVDPKLRVRGLQGLRVADASIFPTMPSANTNAPAMMVGERAAQFMLEAAQGA